VTGPWALISFLLRYPSAEVIAARPALADEVDALPDGSVRKSLELFMSAWTGEPTALAARYVETFDLRRRASLHPPTTRTAIRASAARRCCASRSSIARRACR
jgi:nitrate reductase assembly molybdenum cofactor insertion protein NarJ